MMRYKKIFSVALQHDYYPGGNGGQYRFVPTAACTAAMRAAGAFMKTWNNVLYLIVRVDHSGKPVNPLPENLPFEFFAEPADANFFQFTHVDIQSGKSVYWLKDNPFPAAVPTYLSPSPVFFNAASGYHRDDIVLDEENNAYRALSDMAVPGNVADASKWLALGKAASIRTSSRLFFSNADPLILNGTNYLHAFPEDYQADIRYGLGAMVKGPSNELFEAICNNAPGVPLSNEAAWANRGSASFVTNNALLQMHGPFAEMPVVPAAKTVQVEIFKSFPAGIKPPVQVRTNQITYKEKVSVHQVDLSNLPVGLYEIVINTIRHTVYVDENMQWQDYPVLISIANYRNPAPPAALTDANGVLLSPEYTIRFAPRLVMWQLQFRGVSLPAPVENTLPVSVLRFVKEGAAPNVFLSEKPVQLQKVSYKDGLLLLNNNDPPDTLKINQLPSPGLMLLRTIRQNDTDYFLTTTHLYS
jgi:hypothetical protein